MNRKVLAQLLSAFLGAVSLTGVVAAQTEPMPPSPNQPTRNQPMQNDQQNQPTPQNRQMPGAMNTPTDQQGIAGGTLGASIAETEQVADGYRASKLVRANLYNDKGQKIGKVDDVVVSSNGQVSVAIVDVGGYLGRNKHTVAIPVRQLSQITPRAILPGATKETLKQMPPFEYGDNK